MTNYQYLKPANTPFKDRYVTKISDMITAWDGKELLSGAAIIGAPLSKSSISHSGAAFAPGSIRKALASFSTYSIDDDIDLAEFWKIYCLGDIQMHVTDIVHSQNRIYETLAGIYSINNDFLPIILGGDNSITYPSVKAFSEAKGRIGIIQFDAHHDVRNLEDGGPSNGTPFRSLLETNVIEGKNLTQIGLRNFSNSKYYRNYVEEKGVTFYTMKALRDRSIEDVLSESINRMRDSVDAIYISVDMDVLDQAYAPGCPAIGPGGMHPDTLLDAMAFLGEQPIVKGLEIVEIDPTVDFRDITSRTAAHVILQFLTGKQKRG